MICMKKVEKIPCQGAYIFLLYTFDDFLSFVFSREGFHGVFQIQVYLVGKGLAMDG